MTTQRKVLIIIILVFLLILGGLYFGYQKFIAAPTPGTPSETNGVPGDLFPGSGLSVDGEGGRAEEVAEDVAVPAPVLRQLSNAPSAGVIAFTTEEGTSIRYIERSRGHIFETSADSTQTNRISNTTVPRVQDAIWKTDGSSVILRYLDDSEALRSFYGFVSEEAGVLDGWFLSNDIYGVSVHDDGDIFYLRRIADESEGYIANFDGTGSKLVFSSSIFDWVPQWLGDSIMLTSKAASTIPGFVYRVQSGNLIKLIEGYGIASQANPSGTKILISVSNAGTTSLALYDTRSGNTTSVPFRTLAEKCVWSSDTLIYCGSPYALSDALYPNDWYAGKATFSDDIWSFNLETNKAQLVYDAEGSGYVFDAIELSVDNNATVLTFINKKDLTPWVLKLE